MSNTASSARIPLPRIPTKEEFDTDEEHVQALEEVCRSLKQAISDQSKESARPKCRATGIPIAQLPWIANLRQFTKFTFEDMVLTSIASQPSTRAQYSSKDQFTVLKNTIETKVGQLNDRDNRRPDLVPLGQHFPLVVVAFRLANLAFWNRWGRKDGKALLRGFARICNREIVARQPAPPKRNNFREPRATLYRTHDTDQAHFIMVYRGSLGGLNDMVTCITHAYAQANVGDNVMRPSISYGACELDQIIKFLPYYWSSYGMRSVARDVRETTRFTVDVMMRVARRRLTMATTRSQLLYSATLFADDVEAYTRNTMNWIDEEPYFTQDDLVRLARAPAQHRHQKLQDIMSEPEMQTRISLLDQVVYWHSQNPDHWRLLYHVHCIASGIPWNDHINQDFQHTHTREYDAR
jgi:hypothetical protein